ncbi:hypothetical protein BOX15_Mlig007494g1 [Macrostomum lignano]|uniref:Rho-GAP domain-containing protein n=1 Tax=Macrostomum lignano TaxID=282301 RepID=A0A267GVC5_9PLAT|nr:hypothetical protein BOX15_Mlig007494g1 [Macrostomum lignano]
MLTVRTSADCLSAQDHPVESEYECLVPSASASPAASSTSASASNTSNSTDESTGSSGLLLSNSNSTPATASAVDHRPAGVAVKSRAAGGEFRIVLAFAPAQALLVAASEGAANASATIAELKSAGLRLASRLNARFLLVDEPDGGAVFSSAGSAMAELAKQSLEHLLPASFYRRTPDMLYMHRDNCELSLICVLTCGDNLPRDRLSQLVAALSAGRSSACAYRGRSLIVELCSHRLLIRLASFHTAWQLCDSHAFHGALVAYATDRAASVACAKTLVGNIAHRMPVTLVAMQQPAKESAVSIEEEQVFSAGIRTVHLDSALATNNSWFAEFANECLAAKELTERKFQSRFPLFAVAHPSSDRDRDSFVSPPSAGTSYYDCQDDGEDADTDNSVYSSAGSIRDEVTTAATTTTASNNCSSTPIYSCPAPTTTTTTTRQQAALSSFRPPLASQEICEVYADPPDAEQFLHHHQQQQQQPRTSSPSASCYSDDSTYAYTCNALPPGIYRLVNSRSDYCQYYNQQDSARQPPPPPPPASMKSLFTFNPSASIHSSLAKLAKLGASGGNCNNNNSSTNGQQLHKTYLAVPAPPLTLADLPVCTDQRLVPPRDSPVPQLVVTCIDFVEREGGLKVDGVYRLCGNSAETSAVMDLLLREPDCKLAALKPKPSVCTVTSALKQLLMKLEPSLIPGQLLSGLLKVSSTPRHYPNFQPNVTYYFVNNLSQPALACLRYIVNHLHRVSCYAAENRMNSTNLAVCWIQTLMPPSDPRIGLACQDQLQSLIETLIRYPNLLNPIASSAAPTSGSSESMMEDSSTLVPPPLPSRRV